MSQADRLAEILAEWQERRERGEPADPEDVIRAHPDLADELRSHFELSDLFDRALAVEVDDDPPVVPRRIGEFRVRREIGRGGMGVVYEAEQVSMRRLVALKVLTLAFTTSRVAVDRFQREARAAGRLHHTNIVPIHAMGRYGGYWYYAMELVVGHPLGRVIRELRVVAEDRESRREGAERPSTTSKITEEHLGSDTGEQAYFVRVARLFAGVADALETAHAEGIVHRDVKPGNLLLDESGLLKIVDFGLARLDDGAGMTLTGDVVGTPTYMSPEQARPERGEIDHRTDVYSLGATLYEALTLRPPFRGETMQAICEQIASRDPERPKRLNRHVPRDLETVVLKAMEKDRGKRYATAGDLARDLRAFAEGTAIRARPVGPVGRAWRRVKRNPVRAALISAVIVLATVASVLGLAAARHAREARERDYDRRCREAEVALNAGRYADLLYHFGGAHDDPGSHPPSETAEAATAARRLFTGAIDLIPDRPRAWLGRAMSPGASTDVRLADLDAARERGLSERTYLLVRARFLRVTGRVREAEDTLVRARTHPGSGPMDLYFEARLLAEKGRPEEALALVGRVVDSTGREAALRTAALRLRARLRSRQGRLDGALEDMVAVRDTGDAGLDVEVAIASLWRQLGRADVAGEAIERLVDRVRESDSVAAWARLGAECRIGSRDWHDRVTREALDAHPAAVPLLRERAVALRQAGRLDEALAVCERALDAGRDDRHHGLLETRGWVLLRLKRLEDAVASFDAALELEPDCAIGLRGRGLALSRLDRHEEAVVALGRALELAPFNVLVRLHHAEALEAARKWEEAAAGYRLVLDLQPTFAPAYDRLHEVLTRLGRREEAVELGRNLIDTTGKTPGGAHLRGHVHVRLGEKEEAAAAFDQAMREVPDTAAPYLDKAQVLLELGRSEEALAAVDALRARQPGNAPAHQGRGEILRTLGRHDDALAAFDRSIELDSGMAEAYCGRGSVLYRAGKVDEALAALDRSIELDPRLAPPRVEKGRILRDRGELDEAEKWYRRAIEIGPLHAPGHRELAGCLNEMGRSKEAEPHARRALEIAPGDVFGHTTLAMILENTGRHREALETCGRALEIDESTAEAHWVRASALRHLRVPGKALEAARRSAELDPKEWAARFQAGLALWMMGKRTEAETELVAAAELAPGNWMVWFNLGSLRVELDRPALAVAALEKASSLNPKAAHPHVNRGLVLQRQRRFEEAITAFEKAIELSPKWLLPRINLAVLHRDTGRHLEAAGAFAKAAEVAPPRRRAAQYYDQGLAFERAGRHEDAVRAYDRSLECDETDAWVHSDRGISLANQGKHEEAIRSYERAIEIDEKHGAALNNRGNALQVLHRFDEALASIGRAIVQEPEAALYRCNRGNVLMDMERYEDALRAYDQAVALQPRYPAAHHNRGIALQRLKRHGEAVKAFRRSVAIRPKDGASLYSLAYSLWHAGKHDEAITAYDRLQADRGPEAHVLCDKICVLLERKRFADALAVCREALGKFPQAVHVRRLEVTCLRALGRAEEARKAADEGARSPAAGEHALDRAFFLAGSGRVEEAREVLSGAAGSSDPLLRAVICAVLGDRDGVRRWLRAALAGGTRLPPGSAADPDLEALGGDPAIGALLDELRGE